LSSAVALLQLKKLVWQGALSSVGVEVIESEPSRLYSNLKVNAAKGAKSNQQERFTDTKRPPIMDPNDQTTHGGSRLKEIEKPHGRSWLKKLFWGSAISVGVEKN